jgi:hypothetical protein
MVLSLLLDGCWMFTQPLRLSVGSKYRPVNSEPPVPFDAQRLRGLAFSDHYESESAAVVIARRAYSLGLKPLRAR